MTDFRLVGFTDDAQNYPRDELSLVMFAAFNGVNVEKLPEAMRYSQMKRQRKHGIELLLQHVHISKDDDNANDR